MLTKFSLLKSHKNEPHINQVIFDKLFDVQQKWDKRIIISCKQFLLYTSYAYHHAVMFEVQVYTCCYRFHALIYS